MDDRQTILVIGGSGKTGRRVTERLVANGRRVRPVSRSTDPRFDWLDESTWRPALAGIGAAYLTFHPDLALPGAADTIGRFADVAVAHGVRRLVLLSGRGEEGARRAERRLQTSGADWTIVRCAFFNQNFDETFAEGIREGILAMPAGETAEPFVDAEDIADVVVAALTEARHVGELYELTGPRLLTFAEVAAELGDALGREIHYLPVTVEAFADAMLGQGMPADHAGSVAELIADVLDGRNAYVADGVERALGRAPRDFGDYVRSTAASGTWNADSTPSRRPAVGG